MNTILSAMKEFCDGRPFGAILRLGTAERNCSLTIPVVESEPMSTVIEELEAFRQYVLEHSRTGSTGASLDELFQRWSASRLSEAELEQSLESLRRGLADPDAGRLVDADVVIKGTRDRLLQKL